jgi:hypothetical protein
VGSLLAPMTPPESICPRSSRGQMLSTSPFAGEVTRGTFTATHASTSPECARLFFDSEVRSWDAAQRCELRNRDTSRALSHLRHRNSAPEWAEVALSRQFICRLHTATAV